MGTLHILCHHSLYFHENKSIYLLVLNCSLNMDFNSISYHALMRFYTIYKLFIEHVLTSMQHRLYSFSIEVHLQKNPAFQQFLLVSPGDRGLG